MNKYTPAAFRVRRVADLDARYIAAWQRLEASALEPNVYLSPHFALPASRLAPRRGVFVAALEQEHGSELELLCLGLFERRLVSRQMPIPHLRAFQSRHSYLTGLLVRRDAAAEWLRRFRRALAGGAYLAGIEFMNQLPHGPLYEMLRSEGSEFGGRWIEYGATKRAVLDAAHSGGDYIEERLSAKRKKALRRSWRQLSGGGAVDWRIVQGSACPDAAEWFLALEHKGWKGKTGSSLRAVPADEAFFREVVHRLAEQNRVFFTELLVGRRIIASAVYFIAGSHAFAFKIGWDPEFACASPGFLNELEFVRAFPAVLPQIVAVDSGATQGAFIETLWCGRRTLASGFYATSAVGLRAARCIHNLRRVRAGLAAPPIQPLPAFE